RRSLRAARPRGLRSRRARARARATEDRRRSAPSRRRDRRLLPVHAGPRAGVTFRQGVHIRGLRAEGDRITGVDTDAGPLTADAYVVALGSYSPRMLRSLGIAVPVYPVKGYSLTIPITEAAKAPES